METSLRRQCCWQEPSKPAVQTREPERRQHGAGSVASRRNPGSVGAH